VFACGTPAQPAPNVAAEPSAAPVPTPTLLDAGAADVLDAEPPIAACDGEKARLDQLAAAARRAASQLEANTDGTPSRPKLFGELPQVLGRCFKAGNNGHWLVTASALAPARCRTGGCVEASFELVHVAAGGTRRSRALHTSKTLDVTDLDMKPLELHDIDRDGSLEAWAYYETRDAAEPDDRPRSVVSGLFTLAQGEIRPFTGSWPHGVDGHAKAALPEDAFIVETLVDIDDDGVVDALTHSPFDVELECSTPAAGCTRRVVGPLLVVHGLAAGGFSRSDSAVIADLRRTCRAIGKDVRVVPREPDGRVDLLQAGERLVCGTLLFGKKIESAWFGAGLCKGTAPDSSTCPVRDALRTLHDRARRSRYAGKL
jgi:hypothetical protein